MFSLKETQYRAKLLQCNPAEINVSGEVVVRYGLRLLVGKIQEVKTAGAVCQSLSGLVHKFTCIPPYITIHNLCRNKSKVLLETAFVQFAGNW